MALFLAVKAYKVAQGSYQVSKEQGRSAFELEVLRDLALKFDGGAFAEKAKDNWPSKALLPSDFIARLAMIPRVDLPLWREMARTPGGTQGAADRMSLVDARIEEAFLRNGIGLEETAIGQFIEERKWNFLAGMLHEDIRNEIAARLQ
ncbi:hypothetical protein O7605_16985 [Verrucosispora sp. WMMA2121]|uniref:hypothetical protein n=1 Tax=Verrucosispora sp. WMMA2121 TaxID=3015164 RepID=UPI0022B70AE1|nr:hypothetical protein [Verrucosispora sp. WMMA2121]MCZ7421201.1 hypothetical protein [Verrucosispora sp. WMMA2121]